MPALLTRTSIGWPDSRNVWAARRTEVRSDTSSDTHCARAAGYRLWIALRTGLVRSSERVASTTPPPRAARADRKSTRLNSSHRCISYAVFCLKKKRNTEGHNQPNKQD